MITLISVRLKNFRAVKDATLSPMAEGVTGLSGPNGVGKSAFLVGTLWALYGELPRDERVASLRNDYAAKDDECYVQVEFDHHGDRIIVTRELNKSNTAILNTWLNGAEATVRGVKEGQAWIKNRLGVDAKGFTTAVLVKQKELDDLVDARPGERRMLIERLSGISKMSDALKSARDIFNSAKRDADSAPGDEEEVGYIHAHINEYEDNLTSAQNKVNTINNELLSLRSEYNAAKDALENAKNTSQKHKDNVVERRHAEEALESLRGDLQRLAERAKSISQELPDGGFNPETTASLRREISDLESGIAAKTREADSIASQAKNTMERVERELERAQGELEDRKKTLRGVESTLAEMPEEDIKALQQEFSHTEELRESSRNLIAFNEGIADSLQESINALGDKDECPLCHQGIHDNSELVKSLIETQNKHKASAEKADLDVDSYDEKMLDLRHRIHTQERRATVLDKIEDWKASVAQHEKTVQKAKDEKQAVEDARDAWVTEQEQLLESVKQDKELLDSKRKQLDSYATVESTMRALNDTEAEISRLKEREESLVKRYEQTVLVEKEIGPAPTVEEIAVLQSAHDTAMEAGVLRKEAYGEAVSDVKIWTERLATLQSKLAEVERQLDAKRVLLERAERTSAVANTLDEFRKTQIARIAPELADTATNLISQMTNGHFTEVTLDEDFTPYVVDDTGRTQPVSRLSGGELSVVALALRIAIGDMLTGGEGGLLWLDEVLTAQDADRRASLMETLRALSNRQIVMINHTQGADDIVDRTVRLRKSDDGGTILDES